MSDMPRETLTANREPLTGALPAGLPVLGSGEEGFHQPTWAEQNPGAAAAALIRASASGRVELSPTVNVSPEKKVTEKEKPNFVVEWRKAIIGSWDPSVIEQQINLTQREIEDGRSVSELKTMKIRKGDAIEVANLSPMDYLQELLLARVIYQTPEEAASVMRLHEGLIKKEVTRAQLQEGGPGRANEQFAIVKNGPAISKKEYFDKLIEIRRLVEQTSPEIKQFIADTEAEKKEWGQDYIDLKAERFREHQLLSLVPSVKDLPLFVPFEGAMRVLKQRVPRLSAAIDMEEEQMQKVFARSQEGAISREEAQKRAQETGMQALKDAMERGIAPEGMLPESMKMTGETYLDMYQESWDALAYALVNRSPEIQDEVIVNYFVGGTILGGQYANFFKHAVEAGLGRLPSKWTPWLESIPATQKIIAQKGYLPMDHIFQSIGSIDSAILALPNFLKSRHEMYIGNEKEPRRFEISARVLIGQMARLDTLRGLATNSVYLPKTGRFAVRNGEFVEYLLRQTGFSPEVARKIAYEEATLKTTHIRDRWMSPIRRKEIHNYWDFVGEVALSKLVVAQSWIKFLRVPEEWCPMDTSFRELLSYRGLELVDYTRGYAIGNPNEQFGPSLIALFGSGISIDYKPMLEWIRARFNPNSEDFDPEYKFYKKDNREADEVTEQAKTREAVLNETITVNRPRLDSARHLAMMALGKEEYNLTGDVYRRKLHKDITTMPKAFVEAARHPDIWRWHWFDNADEDISKWRYIGNTYGDNFEWNKVVEAFKDYDFTEELRASGMSDYELKRIETKGVNGWKNHLKYATFGLLDWEAVSARLGDKVGRYEAKKEKAQDITRAFFDISAHKSPKEFQNIFGVDAKSGRYACVAANRRVPEGTTLSYKITNQTNVLDSQQLGEMIISSSEKLVRELASSLGFVLNTTQQAYLEAVFCIYMEGHCAHTLDAYVEDLNLGKSKLAGGANWSVPIITVNDFLNQAMEKEKTVKLEGIRNPERQKKIEEDIKKKYDSFTDEQVMSIVKEDGRLSVLMAEGFWLDKNPKGARDSALISPLSAPLPRVIKARNLLNKLDVALTEALADPIYSSKARPALRAIELMKSRGAFCWDTLINGNLDIPPGIITKALNNLKEEGSMVYPTKGSIIEEILRFNLTTHPHQGNSIDENNSKHMEPIFSVK